MRVFTLLQILLYLSIAAFSQDAKENYRLAKSSLEQGDGRSCIEYLERAQYQLHGSNSKIESLKAQAYATQNDWINAKIAFDNYKKFLPSNQSQSTRMAEIGEQIESELNQLEQEFNDKKDKEIKTSLANIENQIESENGKRIKKLNDLNITNSEQLNSNAVASNNIEMFEFLMEVSQNHTTKFANIAVDWKATLAVSTWQSFDTFIQKYPNSIYSKQAKEASAAAKQKEYEYFIITANTRYEAKNFQQALNYYERAYELKREETVYKRIKNCNEEIDYQETLASKNYDKYLLFMKKYPASKYFGVAEGIIINYHLNEAEDALSKEEYGRLDDNLSKVFNNYSKSSNWKSYESRYYSIIVASANHIISEKREEKIKHVGIAIRYFKHAQNSEMGYDFSTTIKRLERKQKEWTRNDDAYGYSAYRMSTTNNVGLEYGLNTTFKFGGFISWKFSTLSLKEDEFNKNNMDYLTSNFNLNFSRRVKYPLWIYAGAGYASFTKITESSTTPGWGYIDEDSPIGRGVNFDVGLIVILKPINFSIGASIPYFLDSTKEKIGLKNTPVIPSAAIGFTWIF